MGLDAATHYARRRQEASKEVEHLRVRSSAISFARFVSFGAIIALLAGARFARLGNAGWAGAATMVVVFVVLVLVHDRILERLRRAEGSVAWAGEGLDRLAGKTAHDSRPGEPEVDDAHPYAGDLDIVGRGSLLHSIDTTRTRDGRALLARWLLEPADAPEIAIRQACARDLAPRVELREAIAVEGALVAEEPPSLEPLLKWMREGTGFTPSIVLRIVGIGLPALMLGTLLFGGSLPIPRATWVVVLVVQLLVSARYQRVIAPAIAAASDHQAGLARFARMFGLFEHAKLDAEPLRELRDKVAAAPASAEIARLGRIVGFVEARRNEVFKLFIGPALMWDLNCALSLEGWRLRAGRQFDDHLAALARFEALCALAARAFERPTDAWPEVVDDDVVFHASALGHPLIAVDKAVRNGVDLDGAGFVLLVTGSNMSGKSTLLRAIGTNVALALAGAPVRATSMRTSSFAVWTSMRVRDSLSAGVSHFLAELRRLKAVSDAADAASQGRPVLFLLDEILHGTNSRERHLGAQALVRRLVTRRACGAISTHDLSLASLEQELPGRVRNVHFREQVEKVDGVETMTFDYRLREGVVTSSNALRLMRIVGLDVELPE